MFKKSMSIAARTAPAALMVAAFAFVGVTSVSAQVDESETCTDVDFAGTRLIRKVQKVVEFTPIVAIDIPAGPVTIPRATSTDVYDNRINVTQLSELWEIQFIGADGSVIATSGLTQDLPDKVVAGFWEGPITGVTLPVPAVGIRAHHRPDMTTFDTPESVRASGVEVCFPTQVTTTTTTSTTAPPTTPTTAPPTTPTSGPPTTPTTAPPTTPTTPTTAPPTTPTTPPDGPCQSTTTLPGATTSTTDPCQETTTTTTPPPCDTTTTTAPDGSTSTTASSSSTTDPCATTTTTVCSSTTTSTLGSSSTTDPSTDTTDPCIPPPKQPGSTTTTTRPPGTSPQTPPSTLVVVGSETGALLFPAALMLLAGFGLVIVSKRPA